MDSRFNLERLVSWLPYFVDGNFHKQTELQDAMGINTRSVVSALRNTHGREHSLCIRPNRLSCFPLPVEISQTAMARFTDRREGEQLFLCINDEDNQDKALETRLHVQRSLLHADDRQSPHVFSSDFPKEMAIPVKIKPGAQVTNAFMLTSVLPTQNMQDTEFSLLGRRIISGDVRWGPRGVILLGESNFMLGYWEWTEDILSRFQKRLETGSIYDAVYASLYSYSRDPCILRAFLESWCSSTNTLHTMIGELSVSLWDIHKLGGLPIRGSIYDEAVPSYADMTRTDSRGTLDVPRPCQYLLLAYHHLRKTSSKKGVTAIEWIKFWSKKNPYYKVPVKRRRESDNPPENTKDPSGIIYPKILKWSKEELKTFSLFNIADYNRREVTYLSAFLSCWLCTFVLPESKDRLIRPSTFEVATRMALGETFSLSVPVLASIYRGLGMIVTSRKPSYSNSIFPAHYLYGWLACYFKVNHEMRPKPNGPLMVKYSGAQHAKFFSDDEDCNCIHQAKSADLGSFIYPLQKYNELCDDGTLSADRMNYFISLRSAYLPLRYEGSFVLEPYNPYRFGKQFGFCQGPSEMLCSGVDTVNISYREAHRRWKHVLFRGSLSKVSMLIPPRSMLPGFHTVIFEQWWNKVNVKDLVANIQVLNKAVDPESSKKTSKLVDKKSEMVLESSKKAPKLVDREAGTSVLVHHPENPKAPSVKDQQTVHPPSKRRAIDHHSNGEHENSASSGTKSDTNFKHSRGNTRKRFVPSSTRDRDFGMTNIFFDIPDCSDAPSTLRLDGDFDLAQEIPDLVGDMNIGSSRPVGGKGKELRKMKPLDSVDADALHSSPSSSHASQQSVGSVGGRHSLEVMAKLNSENNRGSCRTPPLFQKTPAPAETLVPQTAVAGILQHGLRVAASGLLKTLKTAKLADVEKITTEARLIYRSIEALKGNPTQLRNKVDSYCAAVKAYRYLEEATNSCHRPDEVTKEIAMEKDELLKSQLALDEANAERVLVDEKKSMVEREITDLEEKLGRACEQHKQLVTDQKTLATSCATFEGQIKSREARITELEAAPQLNADDIASLEEQRRAMLELQSSIDPDSWMDFVT